METNPEDYKEAIEKCANYIRDIQEIGFEISYRHLTNSEQEIKFTKKEHGVHQGIEMAFTKIIASREVLNPVLFPCI